MKHHNANNIRWLQIVVIISTFLTHALNSNTLKPHEEWWEQNLGKKMTLNQFAAWLGNENAPSRIAIRNHIKNKGYISILDIAGGAFNDYFGFKKDGTDIEYHGIDITPKLVERALQIGITNVKLGSIENIPLPDNAVEVCYARHILEHLRDYKTALIEMIRVSSKEVVVVFFIKPNNNVEEINLGTFDGHLLYHNQYNLTRIEQFLKNNEKISDFSWQDVNEGEVILHIYLKQ